MLRIVFYWLCFLCFFSFARAQENTYFLMEIKAPIDPRTNRYCALALDEAKRLKVDLVIIEMNTYGGAVNDADEIRQRILEFEKPVFVYINKNAASAGALISIACDSIYMSEGANIGAATVVTQDGTAAPDKYQSYMRSMMRSTAEANGRNPKIAEAMVDQTIEIDSISKNGQVITFTTEEAIKNGFCEAKAVNFSELKEILQITNYKEIKYKPIWSEKLISLILNPMISSILILIMLGGIYFELQTPGVGFPILAAITAAVLYFIPYYLTGLAENWEILVFIIGLVLLGLEFFVIPGFGVAGISGIVLISISLFLVMLNNIVFDFSFVPDFELKNAFGVVGISIVLLFAFILIIINKIPNSTLFAKISLNKTLSKNEGYNSNFTTINLEGKTGVCFTVLKPVGKVKIDEQVYDAETRGEFLEKNDPIIVLKNNQSNTLLVKKLS